MNSDEQRERLVDLLLWESVGRQYPPDVRERVLNTARERRFQRVAAPRLAPLPSARRSRAPVLAIAATVMLLAALAALFQTRRIAADRNPVLTTLSGSVNRADGPVAAGETVSTGTHSSARLTYEDGTTVELSAETRILLASRSAWERAKGFEIIMGGITADVAPQRPGSPMVLSTLDADAEIVGTRLSVQRKPDGTRLEVEEGAVRFVARSGSGEALVKAGGFAEADGADFRHGAMATPPARGITGFTLMNAETGRPLRKKPLIDGDTISLSSLPTTEINIRADYEGDPPESVMIELVRSDGGSTGLPSHATRPHRHPPYFVAGDHWSEGRPEDCSPWTPKPGVYQLTARADYQPDGAEKVTEPLRVDFRITQ